MGAIARFLGEVRIWPGPILVLELVTSTRRTRFFLFRVIYAAILFVAFLFIYVVNRSGPDDINSVAAFTSGFFYTFGFMQLAAILLMGPALAAGAIAQERERKTLDYLYATPLSDLEIIIGKLGGRALAVLVFVLSGAPVLALAMLLGGIAPQSLVSLTVISLSTVLFVTAVSLAVSACVATARDAVVRAYVLFFCLLGLPWLLVDALPANPRFSWIQPAAEQLAAVNPLWTFFSVLDQRLPGSAGPWALLFVLVRNQAILGAAGLVFAALFMRRIDQRQSGKSAGKSPGKLARRMQFFRGQIGDHPMLWKEVFVEHGFARLGRWTGALLALMFVALCGLTIYWYVEYEGANALRPGDAFCHYANVASTALSCCGLLLLTARAAGSISAEKDRDSWTSLISTPLTGREMVKAKILGCICSLRTLLPFLAVVWLPAIILRPVFGLGVLFSLVDLAVLAAFASALGVYRSLRAKTTLRAVGGAIGIVFLAGGSLSCCCPLAFVANIPFLLWFPGYISVEMSWATVMHEPLAGLAVAAYLAGTVGYAGVAALLMTAAIDQFDERCGRTPRRSKWDRRAAPAGHAPSSCVGPVSREPSRSVKVNPQP
jgi:ABC-type transport system involved in multi-copper enzyme maturation permease subunit